VTVCLIISILNTIKSPLSKLNGGFLKFDF
jgi:hypothetical protein